MSLQSLSNHAILSRARRLARCERSLTLRVLPCLNEIERRKLHLEMGYRSLFHFCTSALGYSASAAGRRIQTARAVARYPEILDLLASNQANLTTISMVSRILNDANKDDILQQIRGRTQDDVAALVALYQPRAASPDRAREVVVAVPPAALQVTLQPEAPSAPTVALSASTPAREVSHREPEACDAARRSRSGSECKDSPAHAPVAPPEYERRVILEFSVSKTFMAKLEQVRSLASHRLPGNATLEQAFEFLMDQMIEREDPSRRRERRANRGRASDPKLQRAPGVSTRIGDGTRYVPAHLRDEVFVRDNNRCTFVASNGRRCESTHCLQVDHIVPVALGGNSSFENLRVLCAQHNRLEAERLLGAFAPAPVAARHS